VLALALVFFAVDKFLHSTASGARSIDPFGDLIAVLPFDNRSARAEDGFFTEGVYDDLLTQLAKVSHFKVISRTSMKAYADTMMSVPEIAAQLGAGVVLEGAVQRAGEQVRVTVQLIDGATDVHLWAETYDRTLTTDTVFTIQADVATAIAEALQVVISPDEASALAAGSTASLPAYEAFLQGKLLSAMDVASAERFAEAIARFEQAIELDPAFADAYARKARTELATYWFGYGNAEYRDAAARSLEQARALAPESIETWMAEAYMQYWGQRDYAGAEQLLAQVLTKAPGYADAWYTRGLVARRDGRFEEAVDAMRHALSIDPANTDTIRELVATLEGLGRVREAEALLESSRPWVGEQPVNQTELLLMRGDYDAAWAAVEGPDEFDAKLPFRIALQSRDPARIERALSPELWPVQLRSVPEYPEVYALARAEGWVVTGQRERADAELARIHDRLMARPDPYPAGWSSSGAYFYFPCDLPGLKGDLDGVLAAEQDFIDNAPKDAWAEASVRTALAIAFARAGGTERALDHLEYFADEYGPGTLPLDAVGLESLIGHPRWTALKARVAAWEDEQRAQVSGTPDPEA
jgi:TolB-like protein/Tfp pilus assembly protein PilF